MQTANDYNHSVSCYVLAFGTRHMQTDAFVSDHMKIFTVDSFSMGMGNMAGSLHAIDEEGQEAAVTREISTICHAMRDVGHHVMQCRIFRISDEWFASVMLNVNLWKPYRFYYFNQDSGKLVLLYVFDGEDVTGIRILSAERLHALDQPSIGGWFDPISPDRLIADHPEVPENAARMLFRRTDVFDEAFEGSSGHERRIGLDDTLGLTYSVLLRGIAFGARGETKEYLNEEEKATFQELLDLCPPYEIELIPGNGKACDALVFRFSVFNNTANQQEEWVLIRISDTDDQDRLSHTAAQLAEFFGPLMQCEQPNWLCSR